MNDKEMEGRLQNLGRKIDRKNSRADAVLSRFETENQPDSVTTGATMKPPFPLVRVMLALSACLLFLLGVTSLWNPSSGNGLAFARVQESLQDFETLMMRIEVESVPEMNSTISILPDGSYRFEFANGLASVFDPETGSTLGLNPAKKEYSLTKEDPWAVLSHYRTILDAKKSAVKELGRREFDGQTLAGYLIFNGEKAMGPPGTELWCDPESGRPVMLIESGRIPQDGFHEEHKTIVRFEFNQPVDSSMLSMIPPGGYTKVEQVPFVPMPGMEQGKPLVDDGNLEDMSMRLYSGQGIFNVRFGASRESVVETYGPSRTTLYFYRVGGKEMAAKVPPADAKVTSIDVTYNAFGLVFRFNPEDELINVVARSELEAMGQRGFSGRTELGIRIGDDAAAIQQAYGQPELIRGEPEAPSALGYRSRGIYFALEDGEVIFISIKAPVAPDANQPEIDGEEKGG